MSGIGSFIDGVFEGMDWRENRDDRKRLRKMQDERFGWERENMDWTRGERKHTLSERAREIRRRDEEEAFWKSLANDTDPASGTAPVSADAPASAAGASPLPRPGQTLGGTDPVVPVTPAMPSEPDMGRPQTAVSPAAPAAPGPAAVKPATPLTHPGQSVGPLRAEAEARGAPAQIVDLAGRVDQADALMSDPDARQEAKAAAAAVSAKARAEVSAFFQAATTPAPGSAPRQVAGVENPMGGLGSTGFNDAFPTTGTQTGLGPYADGAPSQPAAVHPRPVDSRPDGPQLGRRVVAGWQEEWDQRYGATHDPATGQPIAPEAGPAVQSTGPAQPMAPSIAEAPANMPRATDVAPAPQGLRPSPVLTGDPSMDRPARSLAAARDRQMTAGENMARGIPPGRPRLQEPQAIPQTPPAAQETAAPPVSAEVVKETTPTPTKGRSIASPTGPVKTTPAQSERAATAFLKNYDEDQVAKVERFYMSRGEPEKAEAYGKWVKDKNVRKGMAHWAKAVHAAIIGDDDRFIDNIAASFNTTGYFDDGFQIVREGSSITRDPETGEFVSAQVVLRDASGQDHVLNFGSETDIYRYGINILSPEQTFDRGWKQIEAADAARLEAAKEERKETKITPENVVKTMKDLADANDAFALLPIEDQRKIAISVLNGETAATGDAKGAADDLPIARRP